MDSSDWEIPADLQPDPSDLDFDLEEVLRSIVGVKALVPPDGFTAQTLGTERGGSGVVIRPDGLIATIGYLVTEAETIWLTTHDGRAIPGHALAYDFETGFGLIQALGRLNLPALKIEDGPAPRPGDTAVLASAGGRRHALRCTVAARQEFAGYWEYLLDEAIFTAPAHPHWGGAALIGETGELLGVGSLQLEGVRADGETERLNMVVPIDLLHPILDDLMLGRPHRPPRPWLGLYATEHENGIVVAGLASGGPAERAGLRVGDVVLAVGEAEADDLAGLFRRIWSLGSAGVEVPLRLNRGSRTVDVRVTSADRNSFLKTPRLH
jgi:S1-C subfamily serine protease